MTVRPSFSTYAVALLALVQIAGSPSAWAQAEPAAKAGTTLRGEKTLEPCHLSRSRQELLCGSHRVFEDRAAGTGREITIRFAVVPAVGEEPQPDPVIVFAGGPGQAATDMTSFVARSLGDVRESRDIVLIDQRGMGESNPLTCEVPQDEASLAPDELRERAAEILRGCVEAWDADPALYTQELANEDIHEIIAALGYEKVNLFGGSWGTRSALLYAHRYPEQVRTVVLDGALPIANPAPLYAGEDAGAALGLLFEDCAADAACAEAFPELEADYSRALERLDSSEDGELKISVRDPVSGQLTDVVLTSEAFGGLLRGLLYNPEIGRILPWIIHRAADGDYTPFFGAAGYLATASEGLMTTGALMVMLCQEEQTRTSAEAPDSLIGEGMLLGVRDACRVFSELGLGLETPAIYGEEIRSSAPALILSGALDPITPPRWGDEMATHFEKALHLVAPATGHNVSPFGCAPDLLTQFIEEGSLENLDGSCLDEIERPSFFVDASGPSMKSSHIEKSEQTEAGGAS